MNTTTIKFDSWKIHSISFNFINHSDFASTCSRFWQKQAKQFILWWWKFNHKKQTFIHNIHCFFYASDAAGAWEMGKVSDGNLSSCCGRVSFFFSIGWFKQSQFSSTMKENAERIFPALPVPKTRRWKIAESDNWFSDATKLVSNYQLITSEGFQNWARDKEKLWLHLKVINGLIAS